LSRRPVPPPSGPTHVEIKGANAHNLRALDVSIPRDRLVVITGLSGSGKSSLAFDTLYAEGQRRYVESLSAYARQFLDQLEKPDVESIEGLSPAISIEQKTVSRSPRSTVGTATEIYDFLRLLYARAGQPHCPRCGDPISQQTLAQMTDRVLALGEGARVSVLAPVVRGRKGIYRKELDEFRSQGFVRVRIDGELRDLSEDIKLARQQTHDIDLVVDRLVVKESARGRISASLETALRLAGGLVRLDTGGEGLEVLSQSNACSRCGISFPEIAPRMFSFNSPHGACPTCDGLGMRHAFDPALLVPDPTRTLAEGAIAPWSGRGAPRYYRQLLAALAAHLGIELDTPWAELPKPARHAIVHGLGNEDLSMTLVRKGRSERVRRRFAGVLGDLERRAQAENQRGPALDRFRSPVPCDGCRGARLSAEARSVKLGALSLPELSALSIDATARYLADLELPPLQRAVADRVLREIGERLEFLREVGLGYLTLDRPSATLSGGEGQRIRLATQVGASLMGVLYILDEPSIGLHARDHARLLKSLERLRDAGNSVVVVEHDEETIRTADHVIDVGPGAGIHGGRIVAEGTPAEIMAHPDSLTGAYLAGRRALAIPPRRSPDDGRTVEIRGCRSHNLKGVDFRVPLGLLTVVTGVSGSGKSTLVNETLHRALAQELHGAQRVPGPFDRLSGQQHLDKVIEVDQTPIGRTPRSNPATYTGAFDGIRALFSQVPEARVRGYSPGRFSFNVKGGRCESCQGDGLIRVEMHFLPDLFTTCEVCRGRRYNRETLEVRYRGKTIADVLEMTVQEAAELLENVPAVKRPLATLCEVGLGYLALGQPATTLSGGEAQRIKLARELARRATGKTLYVLDEPTTGLHFADVERLLSVLQRLVDRGNSVVVIEHHLDVIKSADWVVDLGPEGGAAGGRIVAEGRPELVRDHPDSHTGRALRSVLPA
jgi:excinuclease ABC subunit A